MVCLLRLSQERFVDLQEKMQEAGHGGDVGRGHRMMRHGDVRTNGCQRYQVPISGAGKNCAGFHSFSLPF